MKLFKQIGMFSAMFAAILFVGGVFEAHAQSGSLNWSGTVDQDVELVIRGNNVQTRTRRGNAYRDARYNFDNNRGGNNRGRGRGNNLERGRASVRKEDGRGRVRVVQQPSRRNNFTTIIRIEDPKGGADRYRVRVDWR